MTGFIVALTASLLLQAAAGAHVRLDSPVGGDIFAGGETINVQWDAYLYHGPGTISLDFSADDGATYTPIVTGLPILSADEAVGAYSWTIPAIESVSCRVMVTYTVEAFGTPVDYIDTSLPFTIGPPVEGEGGEPDPGDGMPGEFAITIPASKDNTLFEDLSGSLSNGAGEYMFAGNIRTGEKRRGLISFDIAAAVPFGATITRVSLTLNASKLASSTPQEVTLIPMAADWGEGLSDAPAEEGAGTTATDGDATWIHNFSPSMFWDTPGGDFAATTAAAANVYSVGPQTFVSTLQMIDDVQAWLDIPETNYGWLLVGTESIDRTAIRFDTRENATMANQPALTIDYDLPGSVSLDGSGCLIATAAYGTPLATEIDILRNFRDAHLLDNSLGAAFVDAYYRLSPPIADKVSTSPALSATIRFLLMPILFLANLLTNWYVLIALLLTEVLCAAALHRCRRTSGTSAGLS